MRFTIYFVLIAVLIMTVSSVLEKTNAESEETLTAAPDAPTNLVAITNLPINLSWTASPDPSSQIPVTHYSIERSTNGGITWNLLSGNIGITEPYNHIKAELITYIDSNIVAGDVYDYRVKAHNLVGESRVSNIATAKAVTETSDKIITFGQRAGEKFVPDLVSELNEEESEFLTSFEKNYILTEDDVRDIFGSRWEIIKTENILDNNDTDMLSSEIILKDTTQFFDPIYKKLKLSSIVVELYQFDYEFEQKEFWYVKEYDKTIFDVALKSGFSETTGNCFFENSKEGGMSGCSYDDIIVQVTIFDPYMQHYRYNNAAYNQNDSNLDNEPTLKIVNKILEKINDSKNREYSGNLVEVLRSGQTPSKTIEGDSESGYESDGLETDIISVPQIIDNSIDPETALKAGINHFTCKKNDFGIVSIAGEFVNGVGFLNNAKITITITDENKKVITTDSNNFHNIEKFDTRKFVVYVNTDKNFYDCKAEITSKDGQLNYQRSIRD